MAGTGTHLLLTLLVGATLIENDRQWLFSACFIPDRKSPGGIIWNGNFNFVKKHSVLSSLQNLSRLNLFILGKPGALQNIFKYRSLREFLLALNPLFLSGLQPQPWFLKNFVLHQKITPLHPGNSNMLNPPKSHGVDTFFGAVRRSPAGPLLGPCLPAGPLLASPPRPSWCCQRHLRSQ